MKKLVFASMLIAGALAPVACSKTPGSPSVSFTSPLASQPANATAFNFNAQPVTLTFTNATRTASATATYIVEVATDAGFTNKVFTKSDIAESSGTATTVPVTGLAGGATYYWHSMAVIDGVTGAASATRTFTVAQQVIINAASGSSPANGASIFGQQPVFVTSNVTRTGPASTIFYEFQLSALPSFSPLLATATIQEQSGSTTTWAPTASFPTGTPLMWRVRASDPANGVVGAFSNPITFQLQAFDVSQASFYDNPSDVGSWAQTATITSVVFTDNAFDVDFDLRTGSNAAGEGPWPESGFGDGGVQYTLGMCLNIGGHWDCSAVVQFWNGRDLDASGVPSDIAISWFYDARWGPLQGHQPAIGENVGIFVAQGNLRDNGQTSVKERSNVVIMPFGGSYFAPGTFKTGSSATRPLSLVKP